MKPLIYQYRMQWRELLQCVGVVPDNISSLVHAFGIRLKKQEIWHPAYEAFCRCGEPYVLTMENLKGITEVQPVGMCIHCGKQNGIQLSYGTGAGKECVAAVYVGTAAVCSIKTDFVDRTEWDSHLLQWRS